jgi:hypothetical protein
VRGLGVEVRTCVVFAPAETRQCERARARTHAASHSRACTPLIHPLFDGPHELDGLGRERGTDHLHLLGADRVRLHVPMRLGRAGARARVRDQRGHADGVGRDDLSKCRVRLGDVSRPHL